MIVSCIEAAQAKRDRKNAKRAYDAGQMALGELWAHSRPVTGFIAGLTPEQQARAISYVGDDT